MSRMALAKLNVLLGADASELNRALDTAAEKVGQAGRKMQRVGKTLSTYVTLPLAGAGAAAFKMASTAEESANKFNVVMGDAADDVRQRLEAMTATIPLTRSEMEKLAGGVQDMLVPMGVARGEAAGMSADFVKLAGDLGSFNDIHAADVLMDIQSALAGESQPMSKYGVDTRVAALQTIALEEGLIAAGEAMDRTAMAQAVLIAIQKDSTDAIGDAARTVDSAANQMRFFGRNVKQLGITFGAILIPALTPVIAKLSDLAEWLGGLDPTTQTVIAVVAGLVAALGPLLVVLGSVLAVVPAITAGLTTLAGALPLLAAAGGPITLAVAAFTALVFAGKALVENWHIITYEVGLLVDGIKEHLVGRFTAIVDSVKGKVEDVKGFFGDLYMAVVGGSYVPDMVDGIGYEFGRLDYLMVEPAEEGASRVEGAFQNVAQQGLNAFADFATGAESSIRGFVESAISQILRLLAKMALVKLLDTAIPGAGAFLGFGNIPGRALGGPVTAGSPYIVGEQGPELFVPNASGSIVPNGGGGIVLDASRMPAARDPRQASRDRDWLEFLSHSLREAQAAGVQV